MFNDNVVHFAKIIIEIAILLLVKDDSMAYLVPCQTCLMK